MYICSKPRPLTYARYPSRIWWYTNVRRLMPFEHGASGLKYLTLQQHMAATYNSTQGRLLAALHQDPLLADDDKLASFTN